MLLEGKDRGQPDQGTIRESAKAQIDSQMEGNKIWPDYFNETHGWIADLCQDPEGTLGWNFAEKILADGKPPCRHYAERYLEKGATQAEVGYLLSKSDPAAVREIDEIVDLINAKLPAIIKNRDEEGLNEIKEALNRIARFHPHQNQYIK